MFLYIYNMKNSISTIKHIIELYETFTNEQHENETSLNEFVLWLNKYLFDQKKKEFDTNHSPDIEITFLITLLNKTYKNLTKKVLSNSEISNADSYSLLYHLYMTDSIRKMELISLIQLEAPTGIEIIKRLLSKKMIQEFADSNDKRAKRIQITKKGSEEIEKLIPEMDQIYSIMAGHLDEHSKIELVSHLSTINKYHHSKK